MTIASRCTSELLCLFAVRLVPMRFISPGLSLCISQVCARDACTHKPYRYGADNNRAIPGVCVISRRIMESPGGLWGLSNVFSRMPPLRTCFALSDVSLCTENQHVSIGSPQKPAVVASRARGGRLAVSQPALCLPAVVRAPLCLYVLNRGTHG